MLFNVVSVANPDITFTANSPASLVSIAPNVVSVANQGGLDVSLVSGNDGVDVQLNSAVGEQNKKMAFIVIEV